MVASYFRSSLLLMKCQKSLHKMKFPPVMETFHAIIIREFMIHINYVIEGQGVLVNEAGKEFE